MWLPEFWAHDALSPLGALAHATVSIRLGTAVVQLGTRTPAMLAMSAMTLQQLSGGRFVLGVDLTVAVSCEFTDDLDAAGRRHAEGCVHVRCDGLRDDELLQPRLRAAGLRRCGCRGPATVARRGS